MCERERDGYILICRGYLDGVELEKNTQFAPICIPEFFSFFLSPFLLFTVFLNTFLLCGESLYRSMHMDDILWFPPKWSGDGERKKRIVGREMNSHLEFQFIHSLFYYYYFDLNPLQVNDMTLVATT